MPAPGVLYVVGTPIGNLDDLTYRAAAILKSADIIASEDTRWVLKLFGRCGISGKRIVQYSEATHFRKTAELLSFLEEGKNVALVSRAGSPGISDPGSRLVAELIKKKIKVLPIPGVSAPVAALSVSPFDSRRFIFLGFLPRKKGKTRKLLDSVAGLLSDMPAVIFESPYRIKETLIFIRECLGPDISVLFCREMTKLFEEYIFSPIDEIIERLSSREIKGEITIVIKKAEKSIDESEK